MHPKLSKHGDHFVVPLSEDMIQSLGWDAGDVLSVEISGTELRLVRTMTAHDHAMEIARKCMDEYHDTFVALAKS